MKRIIEYYLQEWKTDPGRKSLLIRGARQVGKTFSIREFGKTFHSMLEVNFERKPDLGRIFDHDLDPRRIARDLALACNQPIEIGKTLLFLDEVQQAPRVLTALRYFNEEMPELHVVAAGSLVEFVLQDVGVPVGRVGSLHMYPLSFVEYLAAKGKRQAVAALANHGPDDPFPEAVHQDLLRDVGEYLAIGGMPEAIQGWIAHDDLAGCSRVHVRLAETYRQDFAKYGRKYQVKYLDLLFDEIPRFLGQKFVFSRLKGSWRRRDLQPALDLLVKAGVAHTVCRTAATGVPFGAEQDPERFKALFLDIGLAQSILGFDGSRWILDPGATFVNAGELAEAFVGQELLAYSSAHRATTLHYWHREERSSQAEVDYVIAAGDRVIPVEVKGGTTGRLRSMNAFLHARKDVAPYGVRFSMHPFSAQMNLHSYPLYGVGSLVAAQDGTVRGALRSLA
jgi:predicted AAA+ superfamily ATPase